MSTDADILLPNTQAALEGLGPADLVIAATGCATDTSVVAVAAIVREAALRIAPTVRSVLVYPDTVSVDDAMARAVNDPALQLLPCRLKPVGRLPFAADDDRELFHPLAAIAGRLGARACGLIGARPEGITADTVYHLAMPVLERDMDLLLPSYVRHRFEGLINTGIVYPLTRALYGKRVDGQLGIDFGFSPRLLAALVERNATRRQRVPIWLLTEATELGMRIGQARLGAWQPPVDHATDVSTALAEVLGSLFEDMEQHASTWQRTRGSLTVPVFGPAAAGPDEARAVDTHSMVESFGLGFRNLREVWGQILPPATMVELGRMTRAAPEAFRMPDRLWVRIVFDFAIGYRIRVIPRDQLVRAMTPLYLAWVASFVEDPSGADPRSAEERSERLCVAYETEKPYLLSRWRWPDRFNP